MRLYQLRQIKTWIALIIVVLVVFGPVAGHHFLDLDDAINITGNHQVTDFSLDNLLSFWQKPYANLYIPVTYNLWAFLAKLSSILPGAIGGQPNSHLFHSANLIVHLAAAILVFCILKELCGLSWAAWAGAVLFAIHPVQVEAVAWCTGMKDLLSGFFSLMAIWLYIRYERSATEEGRRKINYLVVGAVSYLLAMLSKPGAVVTPVLAWLIGVLILDRQLRRTFIVLLPWVALAIPVIAVTRLAQGAEAQHVYEPALWQRILVAGDSISFYLAKLCMPITLGPDYGRTPDYVLGQSWVYLTGILPVLLVALLVSKGRRAWLAAAGIFISVLLPVSGIIPFVFQQISTVADRYLYLAMLGPAYALAAWLARSRSKYLWVGVVIVLSLLMARSIYQVRIWHDPEVFYHHALAVNPRSWTSYNNLGNYLADNDQPHEAAEAYKMAISLVPEYAEAFNNLGTVLADMEQWDEAIHAFSRAVAINPSYVEAAVNLGNAWRLNNRPQEAIAAYKKAISVSPSSASAYNALCSLYQELEFHEEAAACYNKFMKITPENP